MKDPLETVDRRQAIRIVLLVAACVALLLLLRPSLVVTIGLVVGLVVIVMLHEFGHFLAAKRCGMKVTEFFLGFGPRVWSFRRGETEYGVKAIPAGGYVRIVGMSNLEEVDPEDEPRTYRAATTGRRLAVVLAGISVNLVLALVLVFPLLWREGVVTGPSTTLGRVASLSPAQRAGLHAGDTLLAIDGRGVTRWSDVPAAVKPSAGRPLVLTIERHGRAMTLTAVPEPRSPTDGSGFLGVTAAPAVRKLSFPAAIGESFVTLGQQTRETGSVLGHFFSPAGVREQVHSATRSGRAAGGLSNADLERPMSVIGFVNVGSQLVGGDLWLFLALLSSLNLFLALFNLVPLMPFDGGHAAIAVYEGVASKLAGRPVRVDFKRLMPVTAAVLAVLVVVGTSIIFLDIRQIITGS